MGGNADRKEEDANGFSNSFVDRKTSCPFVVCNLYKSETKLISSEVEGRSS